MNDGNPEMEELRGSVNKYVSALHGDDGNPGTKERPYRSIQRARDELRKLIARGDGDGAVLHSRGGKAEDGDEGRNRGGKGEYGEGSRGVGGNDEYGEERLRDGFAGAVVWIGEGRYELEEPLAFDERDSGLPGGPVAYRSMPGERPVLSGGRALHGWTPYTESIYRIHLGAERAVHTLFEDCVRGAAARWPKSGYFTVAGHGTGRGGGDFTFAAEDLPEPFDYSGAQVYIWPGEGEWNWFSETKTVASIDWERRILSLVQPSPWGIDRGSRYRIQNALAMLTEPGEFYWDAQAGDLYYWPRRLPIEERQIVVPLTERVVELKGSSAESPLRHLSIEGLTIEMSAFAGEYRMPEHNCERPGARHGLIYMENTRDIAVTGCRIRHAGFSAVVLNGSCSGCRIESNLIERSGYTGVYLIGPAPGEGDYDGAAGSYVNRGNRIRNNLIRNGGELVGHSSGIQLYQSGGNEVTNNRICGMPRYGISLKGLRYGGMAGAYYGTEVTWDNHWDFLHSRDNLIAGNDISDVMKDSQDGGMLESWGAGLGNRIVGNRFHHSGIYFSFGFCIYLDDASDGYFVSENIIHDLFQAGSGVLWFVVFSKGIGNRIENNLLVSNEARAAFGTQEMVGEANRDIAIVRNIVCDSGAQLYHFVNWADDRLSEADYNLFWRGGAAPSVTGIYGDDKMGEKPVAWERWREMSGGRFDEHTVTADPLLENREDGSGDFRLREGSPAFGLGWKPIDAAIIGLTSAFPFRDEAGE